MKTNTSESCSTQNTLDVPAGFYRKMAEALAELKVRLRERYVGALPGRRQTIEKVIAESEVLAQKTAFPHLLLPDFVQTRLEALFPDEEGMSHALIS